MSENNKEHSGPPISPRDHLENKIIFNVRVIAVLIVIVLGLSATLAYEVTKDRGVVVLPKDGYTRVIDPNQIPDDLIKRYARDYLLTLNTWTWASYQDSFNRVSNMIDGRLINIKKIKFDRDEAMIRRLQVYQRAALIGEMEIIKVQNQDIWIISQDLEVRRYAGKNEKPVQNRIFKYELGLMPGPVIEGKNELGLYVFSDEYVAAEDAVGNVTNTQNVNVDKTMDRIDTQR